MKKTARKLMCLALVMLLVATMAVPAMAVRGTCYGYTYNYTVTREETKGTAYIYIEGSPTFVSAHVKNKVYNQEK